MGLLENDIHWFETMREACLTMNPSKIRDLFTIMIVNCGLCRPLDMWEEFKKNMSDDILHRVQQNNSDVAVNDHIYKEALILIQNEFISMSSKDLQHYGFPALPRSNTNNEILRKLSYDIQVIYVVHCIHIIYQF